jgi:hypothetical protein
MACGAAKAGEGEANYADEREGKCE